MTTASHNAATLTNRGTAGSCGGIETSCGLGKMFRAIWPAKTAPQLADTASISLRKAEYILAGATSMSLADVSALLRSEHGGDVLKHLMAGARPTWWRDLRRQMEISELRKRQESQRRLIERLEREAGG